MKQVLAACDAGIATSVAVNDTVEGMAKEHNIKVDIRQVEIAEIGLYEDTTDSLVTTAMTKKKI